MLCLSMLRRVGGSLSHDIHENARGIIVFRQRALHAYLNADEREGAHDGIELRCAIGRFRFRQIVDNAASEALYLAQRFRRGIFRLKKAMQNREPLANGIVHACFHANNGLVLGDALHMRKRFAQLIVRHPKQAIRLFKLSVQGLLARHVDSNQTAAPHTTQAHLVAHKQACFIRRNLESNALGQHLATLFARHIAKVGP